MLPVIMMTKSKLEICFNINRKVKASRAWFSQSLWVPFEGFTFAAHIWPWFPKSAEKAPPANVSTRRPPCFKECWHVPTTAFLDYTSLLCSNRHFALPTSCHRLPSRHVACCENDSNTVAVVVGILNHLNNLRIPNIFAHT